jgi:hypothetical protein
MKLANRLQERHKTYITGGIFFMYDPIGWASLSGIYSLIGSYYGLGFSCIRFE